MILTAQLDDEPIPSTQWYKDGQLIKQTDDIKIINRADGTASLIADVVTPEHAGKYEIKALNNEGHLTISTAVSVEPPKR